MFFLEKSYLSKERLLKPFSESDILDKTWKRHHSQTGLREKSYIDNNLEGKDKLVYEIRTLQIKMIDMEQVFLLCKELLEQNEIELIQEAKREIESMGLKWKK